MERVPTEVSSVRLLRAYKSEVDVSEVSSREKNPEQPADFVTIKL